MILSKEKLLGKEKKLISEKQDEKYYEYRKAIKDKYGIDIDAYEPVMHGGLSQRKHITDFDLNEILMGMNMEHHEHGGNFYVALEIVLDHLTENPKSYSEEQAREGKH